MIAIIYLHLIYPLRRGVPIYLGNILVGNPDTSPQPLQIELVKHCLELKIRSVSVVSARVVLDYWLGFGGLLLTGYVLAHPRVTVPTGPQNSTLSRLLVGIHNFPSAIWHSRFVLLAPTGVDYLQGRGSYINSSPVHAEAEQMSVMCRCIRK